MTDMMLPEPPTLARVYRRKTSQTVLVKIRKQAWKHLLMMKQVQNNYSFKQSMDSDERAKDLGISPALTQAEKLLAVL